MGVRSEHRLRLLRVDHRRDLRRLVAWMKASTENLSHRGAVIILGHVLKAARHYSCGGTEGGSTGPNQSAARLADLHNRNGECDLGVRHNVPRLPAAQIRCANFTVCYGSKADSEIGHQNVR